MNTSRVGICLAALAAVLSAAPNEAAGKSSKCSDIPVSFTISSMYSDPSTMAPLIAGIRPDNGGPYSNGQSGVTALIHVCNGSNGATLNPGSNRTITYDFRNAVSAAGAPTWTSVPQSLTNAWLNFSNLLYTYNANGNYTFTTYLKYVNLTNGYYFAMENPLAKAPFDAPDAINSPCTTSLVNVQHIPANSGPPATPETWIVWADSTPQSCNSGSFEQVGSLYSLGHPSSKIVEAGQFTVPFYITIQRLP